MRFFVFFEQMASGCDDLGLVCLLLVCTCFSKMPLLYSQSFLIDTIMRRILFAVLLSVLLFACSSQHDKICGEWEIASVMPGDSADPNLDYALVNEIMKGLHYRFDSDSLFVNDSLVGTYILDSASFVLKDRSGVSGRYFYDTYNDSLVVENDVLLIKMKRISD